MSAKSARKPQAPAKPAAVEFRCHAPDAKQVFVAGSFNDWKADATPMTHGEAGDWRAAVSLSPGYYEFKFVVDDQWCCNPGCPGGEQMCPQCVLNAFGTMNRVLHV